MPFLWPVPGHYAVSSGFNDVRGYGPHSAIDIPAPTGTPIVSVAAGRVAFAGRAGDCGLAVFSDHAGGWRSHYCHLSQLFVLAGEPVVLGQRIGDVGVSGVADGPHLHINLFASTALPGSRYVAWVNKYAVDPLLYLVKEDDMATLEELARRVERLEKRVGYEAYAAALSVKVGTLFQAGQIDSAQRVLDDVINYAKKVKGELTAGRIAP